jgi:hypothetical protein
MKIHNAMYPHRFTIFTVSLIAILFGTLIIPTGLFESVFMPLFFIVNILTGIVLISKKKIQRRVFIVLLAITILSYIVAAFFEQEPEILTFIRFSILFLFYCMVTLEIIAQVWLSKEVNSKRKGFTMQALGESALQSGKESAVAGGLISSNTGESEFLKGDIKGTMKELGTGAAIGGGLDFPVKLKETYISIELLWHMVNFFDKETSDWDEQNGGPGGVNDLTGNAWSLIVTYNATW